MTSLTVTEIIQISLLLVPSYYGIFCRCEWSVNRTLPMSACVNASQSFPLINAYSSLHGVGRLADGGLFENSETSTTAEVYVALRKLLKLPSHRQKKVGFTIITILNDKVDIYDAVKFKRASIFNTLTAVANNSFTGHQLMAVNQLGKTDCTPGQCRCGPAHSS